MTNDVLPSLDDECFFIAPIGSEGSDVRDRSDGVMEYIVGPAAAAVELVTIRADKIAKPGQITRQVIEHVVGAKAAVVDLTGANPNVYYEMAVRHTAQLPTVLIAQDGEQLPFDISQMRTIFFDHTSLKSAAACRDQIAQHLQEAMKGEVDSPIAASVTVTRLEQGTPQDRVLAQLVDGLDEVRNLLRQRPTPYATSPTRVRHVRRHLRALENEFAHKGDRDTWDALREISIALQPLLGDAEVYPSHIEVEFDRRAALAENDERLRELEGRREDEREAERDAERDAEREAERQAEHDRVDNDD